MIEAHAFKCLGAGLHAYGLDIRCILVDGREAAYELRPHFEEALPEQVLDGEDSSLVRTCVFTGDDSLTKYPSND